MDNSQNQFQKCRQRNIEAIVSYFETGIKRNPEEGRLGIEVEYFIVHADGSPVQFHEPYGVDWLLEQLNTAYPERVYGKHGELIGVSKPGATVTLEPGAQIELSAGPYRDLSNVRTDFEEFGACVKSILEPYGESIASYGYRPAGTAKSIALIPKTRYDIMDRYFADISEYGTYMMRGSAATQASIDYFSVSDCLKKLKIASSLAPLFSLICDNAPVFEGAPRTHALMRSDVWRYCDPDRCGTIPGVLSSDFSLEAYASFVLDTPAILVPDGRTFRASSRTFGEEYADTVMTVSDVEHALSMFFTDARLKTYIEIRPADSMPAAYVASYAALIKGLFYNSDTVDLLVDSLQSITEADVAQAKAILASDGFDGIVFGKPAHELLTSLLGLSTKGLKPCEQAFLGPFFEIAQSRKTLADRFEQNAHL